MSVVLNNAVPILTVAALAVLLLDGAKWPRLKPMLSGLVGGACALAAVLLLLNNFSAGV